MLNILKLPNLKHLSFEVNRSEQLRPGAQSGPGPRLPARRAGGTLSARPQAHSRPPRQALALWLRQAANAIHKPMLGLIAALMLGLSPASAGTQPLPPLNREAHINQSLLSAAIGEAIRQNCSTISARLFRAFTKAMALERYATKLGYSKVEIKAFISDKTEKQRMRDETVTYLVANGVIEGQEQTFCALGQAEIARNSLTGQLLRSRR